MERLTSGITIIGKKVLYEHDKEGENSMNKTSKKDYGSQSLIMPWLQKHIEKQVSTPNYKFSNLCYKINKL